MIHEKAVADHLLRAHAVFSLGLVKPLLRPEVRDIGFSRYPCPSEKHYVIALVYYFL